MAGTLTAITHEQFKELSELFDYCGYSHTSYNTEIDSMVFYNIGGGVAVLMKDTAHDKYYADKDLVNSILFGNIKITVSGVVDDDLGHYDYHSIKTTLHIKKGGDAYLHTRIVSRWQPDIEKWYAAYGLFRRHPGTLTVQTSFNGYTVSVKIDGGIPHVVKYGKSYILPAKAIFKEIPVDNVPLDDIVELFTNDGYKAIDASGVNSRMINVYKKYGYY